MKKFFALLLACCLLFAGCASAPAHTVQMRTSRGGDWVEKNITNPTNGVETKALEYNNIFVMTPEGLVAEVDKRAAEKGYSKLTKDSGYSDSSFSYSGSASISGQLSYDHIREITLYLYSTDEATAKANGDYLYIFIDVFNPGMQELIADELLVFEEITADSPGLMRIICGNTVYSFYDSKLHIYALAPPYVEPPQPPTVIRPQS